MYNPKYKVLDKDFKRTKIKLLFLRLWNRVAETKLGVKMGLLYFVFLDPKYINDIPFPSDSLLRMLVHLFYKRIDEHSSLLNQRGEQLFKIGVTPSASVEMRQIMKDENLTYRDWDKITSRLNELGLLQK